MVKIPGAKLFTKIFFQAKHKSLESTVADINFPNPVGLAAGFDHEAQLPGIIGELGFGFESVGTITNGVYSGNPYPRIKRLVNSKAILVNKGFKSTGMKNGLHLLEFQSAVQIQLNIILTKTLSMTLWKLLKQQSTPNSHSRILS